MDKKTRKIFALIGDSREDSSKVLQTLTAIQFKGLQVFNTVDISTSDIFKAYLDNKSIVCPNCSIIEHENPIMINVINSPEDLILWSVVHCTGEYIDASKDEIMLQFQHIAEAHNCDIGDPKSNRSGLNGAPKISDCCYCKFYYKGSNPHNQKIIYQSENFFVIATLGEFINGYILIIPKSHVMSCAEFDKELMTEFLEVLDDVLFILKKTYNAHDFLVWENGTGNGGKGKAKDSIVHAHVHVAPSKLTANKIELQAGFPLKKISTNEIADYKEHSYLMIKEGSNWRINDEPSVYIPRQYIRQLLVDEYNLGDVWNWRTHPFIDKMEQTYRQIITALKNDLDNIPDRIKSRIVID